MNERIFQLVGQAISKVPVPITFNHEHSMFAEKFAELIVRECAKVAGDFEYARLHDSLVEDKIKEHFGVEQ